MHWLLICAVLTQAGQEAPHYAAELIFPLDRLHNHAPSIVECPNGDLLVSWYRGSGERQADDVRIMGARKRHGSSVWSKPFVMADRPGFPDCNTAMMIDRRGRLWLFWPTILANTWESCITNYRVSDDYLRPGPPLWTWQDIILLKPGDFADEAERILNRMLEQLDRPLTDRERQEVETIRRRLRDKLYRRLGWQPRCKPLILPSGRILLPLYSDTFSISILAISDDGGRTWYASKPLIGFGNIQPTLFRRNDGTIVAYMRENGPRDCIRVAESKDEGLTWSEVGCTELPNPGAGIDGVRLANGHWVLVYNDTTKGRHRLAISLSDDEGKTWKWTRHLENDPKGRFHYPAVIQGRDGNIHIVYSYFVPEGKSIKHVEINEAWIRQSSDAGTGTTRRH